MQERKSKMFYFDCPCLRSSCCVPRTMMIISLHALSHLISSQVVHSLIPILQNGELRLKRVGIGKPIYQGQVLMFHSVP